MAGYIYCMKNTHHKYGRYVKVGYTERRPDIRREELSKKWRCTFTVCWDMEVYEAAKAEEFIHEILHPFRVVYEFFATDTETVKELAERHFDEHWREIEGVEVLPENVVDLAEKDNNGLIIDFSSEENTDFESGMITDHGPDSDYR